MIRWGRQARWPWRALGVAACIAPEIAQAQAAASPQSGPFSVTPGLQVETAAFLQGNSWFGQSQANIGAVSKNWTETVLTPSVDWRYPLDDGSSVYGRLSAIGAATDGVDAGGSNANSPQISAFEIEDSYVGWRSGSLFADTLGTDAVDITIGRLKYQLGSGFLFWKESNNGASRAANGIAPRKAARLAADAKLSSHGWTVETVYLKFNDRPSTHTQLAGTTIYYSGSAWGLVGFGVYKVLTSNYPNRAGMTVLNLRGDIHPIPQLRGLDLTGEYVREQNGDLLATGAGFLGIGYAFSSLPFAPYVDYRRATFRGNSPNTTQSEAYDPFSLGISNWGSLLVGKYVLSNSNQRANSLRLVLQPLNRLKLTTQVYRISLDQPLVPTGVRDFADEVDLVAEWAATQRLTLSVTGAVARPRAAALEITGGDHTWSYVVLDARWAY